MMTQNIDDFSSPILNKSLAAPIQHDFHHLLSAHVDRHDEVLAEESEAID